MTLKAEVKVGLTIGEIQALTAVLGNVRIADLPLEHCADAHDGYLKLNTLTQIFEREAAK